MTMTRRKEKQKWRIKKRIFTIDVMEMKVISGIEFFFMMEQEKRENK